MTFHQRNPSTITENTKSFDILAGEKKLSYPDIIMNCFHPENIIIGSDGNPMIHPQTVGLAASCLVHMTKLMERKKMDMPQIGNVAEDCQSYIEKKNL